MISNKSLLISLTSLLLSLLLVGIAALRPDPVIINMKLDQLPKMIGSYRGVDVFFPEAVYRELNADKHVYRQYNNGDGRNLYLYIGYYGTAKGGRTGHNPFACLPGAGWAIIDSKITKIQREGSSEHVKVNFIHANREGVNAIMLHWYQTAGVKVLSTGLEQNIERFWGRLLHNRNDGAFVQVTVQVPDSSLKDGETKVGSFAEEIVKLLPDYWPIEKDY